MRSSRVTRRVWRPAIHVLAADHDGRRHPGSPHRGPALGYLLRLPPVLVPGDTGPDLTYQKFALVDIALVPVGGWGPTLGQGHLDAKQAAQAVHRVQQIVPFPYIGEPCGPSAFHGPISSICPPQPSPGTLPAWHQPPASFSSDMANRSSCKGQPSCRTPKVGADRRLTDRYRWRDAGRSAFGLSSFS